MIHRTARERLLFEAREVAREVEELEGIRGHSASLENSDVGPARIVRVWHDGSVVTWSFSLEAGEARPQFYPEDVPFIPAMGCEMGWDDETGLQVKWRERLDAQGQAEFREKMDAFGERVEEVTGKPLKPGVKVSAEEARSLLERMAFPGQEDAVGSVLEEIVEFHEAAGWNRGSDSGSGPFIKIRLNRGEVERRLVATTFGVSLIVLEEGGEESGESRTDGSDQRDAAIRLKLGR